MRRPDPVWECEYANDRRKHRHRCFCCKKIIQPGEMVLMCRMVGRSTRACHIEHADRSYIPGEAMTVRQVMNHWGLQALKKLGWRVTDEELSEELRLI